MTLAEPILAEARTLLCERLGLEFPARRADDLERALADRSLATLRAQPTSGPDWRALISELIVPESYFFRDATLFAALEQVLSALIAERSAAGERRLTLWSAGCAAGQEPYSLAMLLDRLLPDRDDWALTIHATDVDAAALAAAAAGRYSDWALRDTPAWAKQLHFRARGHKQFELSRQIRSMVTFAPLNLAADGYPGSLDVIVCRNVLMYFADAARKRAVGRLVDALAPGGWLALSPLDARPEPLAAVEIAGCRLQRRERPRPPRRSEPRPPATAPAPPVDVLSRAREEADRGRLEAARALCHEARRERPLDADAHLLLAAVEEERGDLDAAIAALKGAIYAAPDGPTAHFRLGGLLLRTGAAEPGRRSLATAAALLGAQAPGTLVPGGDGLTAGRLLETARAQLEPTT